jgi:hypothetical protein
MYRIIKTFTAPTIESYIMLLKIKSYYLENKRLYISIPNKYKALAYRVLYLGLKTPGSIIV